MARSLIRGGQVVDEDFVSHVEHGDPLEVPHTFLMNTDTPVTYSGRAGMLVSVRLDASGIEFTDVVDGGTFL